jgi:hypothetical protein
MRVALAMIVVVCGTAAIAQADPARAKAANTRGYALHKQKKYKEAAVEYRKAIAEDPSYLIAHYNLACVASLTKDSQSALRELAWVADRAAWDPAAKSAAEKSRTDHDLDWLRDTSPDATVLTSADLLDYGTVDLLSTADPDRSGTETSDASLVKAIASAPGKHEGKCSNAAFSVQFDNGATETVVATLRDGVALLDEHGKLKARSEPIGCTGPGERITMLNRSDAVQLGGPDTAVALTGARVVVVMYWVSAQQHVTIFTFTNKEQLVRAFDAVMLSSVGDGSLLQTRRLGNLVYTAPGTQKPRVFRLDGASWKYVEEK